LENALADANKAVNDAATAKAEVENKVVAISNEFKQLKAQLITGVTTPESTQTEAKGAGEPEKKTIAQLILEKRNQKQG